MLMKNNLKLNVDIKFCEWWKFYLKPDTTINKYYTLEGYKKLKEQGKIR